MIYSGAAAASKTDANFHIAARAARVGPKSCTICKFASCFYESIFYFLNGKVCECLRKF